MPIIARARTADVARIIVAKYRRVSTLDQLDGFGLEDQDQVCDGWLSRNPEALLNGDYVDEAVSGALESRPDMDRLVVEAHRGAFNRILVPKVDRVGRTARAAYQWAWNMADIGVYFISVQEGIDTSTDAGWAMFQQYVTFSEMEWRRIKERTFAGRELKMSYGGWPGGMPPYGYKIANDPERIGNRKKRFSVLVTDEKESMVLWTAVMLLVDEGMNLTETVDALNQRGLFTRSGVPWTVGNLRNRLHAETIHDGYVLYRKTNRGNGKNSTLRYDDGTPVYGDQVKIAVPEIFTADRAEALKKRLRVIGFQNGRKGNRIYPLSTRIKSRCGKHYTGVPRSATGGGRNYRCQGTLVQPSCGEPNFDSEEIENAVWRELTKLLADESRLRVMAEEWKNSLPGDQAMYRQRVNDFEVSIAKQQDLIDVEVPKYIRAGVSPDVLKSAVAQMKSDLADLKKKLVFAQQWLTEYTEYERQANNLVSIANNAREHLDTMGLAERREIFAMFNITVHPGDASNIQKPGAKCEVTEWHLSTGTLVPPDPTPEEWASVVAAVRPYFAAKHFTSRFDIRTQFAGMLHRLRHGLTWVDMPSEFGAPERMRQRQLDWWKRGAWPEVMAALNAGERGVAAYKRPTLPQLTVTGQLRAGLLAEVRSEAPRDLGEAAISSARPTSSNILLPSTASTGVERPMQAGVGFKFFLDTPK